MHIKRQSSRSTSADYSRPRYLTPAPSFWILSAFLILLFITGGSSREDAFLLPILRPAALLLTFYTLATLPRERWLAYRYQLILAGAIIALTLSHLVPLPTAIWHALPGRDDVRIADAAVGSSEVWRPLSLVPARTINALFFLFIPFAVFLTAIRLTLIDRNRLLYVMLALGFISAIIGLLQSAGMPISLYHGPGSTGRVDAAGVFANQNHQAALLAIMIPILAVLARSFDAGNRKRLLSTLLASSAVAILVLLIVTGSRSGLVLGIIAITFTMFYGLLVLRRLDRMPFYASVTVKLAMAAIVIGGAAAITILTSRDVAFSRLALAGDDLRPRLWASIAPILPQYQPWGSGIGSYVEVYRAHEPTALLRNTFSNHAHNEYLEVLMTAGLPGLVLLVAAMVLVLRTAIRHRRGPGTALQARLGVTIIVILAAASITDYPLRTPLLAAILALAVMWCGPPSPQPPVPARTG